MTELLTPIAFTVSGQRAEYLKRALESWSHVRGISSCLLTFYIEPGEQRPESYDVATSVGFAPWSVIPNPEHRGIAANTGNALWAAARHWGPQIRDKFGLVAEEDVEVADDILEYARWAAERWAWDERVMGVATHTHQSAGEPSGTFTYPWFDGLVWGTWSGPKAHWVAKDWRGIPGNPQAWDRRLSERCQQEGREFVFPQLSRCRHFGEYSTDGRDPARFPQTVSQSFRPHYDPQEYVVLPTD